jgi:uncharacterized protein (UPF0332 family)
MSLEELERRGKIKRYQARRSEIDSLLLVARRDLVAAERNLAEDADWSYNMSYNAILQAARALMFSRGYRPRGTDQHRTVVRFAKVALGDAYARETALFDQMRRKRNRLLYETVGLASNQEAQQALALARRVVEDIGSRITGQSSLEI